MKRTTLLLSGLALGAALTLLPQTGKSTIVGTSHDFYVSTNMWAKFGVTDPYVSNGTNNSVCSECHQIHHAPDPTKGPLWIHSSSANAGSYKLYNQAGSESYDALGLDAPTLGSSSVSCLSCHDGTVGINQTTTLMMDGTTTTTNKLKGTQAWRLLDLPAGDKDIIAVNGNDLTHTHPIGIDYNAAVTKVNAINPGELKPAVSGAWPYNRLKGVNHSQLECATCHDIHNTFSIPSGSARCLSCHNK